MSRTVGWRSLAAVALSAGLFASMTSPSLTEARWSDRQSVDVVGPTTDVFDLSATNVPDDGLTGWPAGRLATTAQVRLSNGSARQTSWVDVRSTRIDPVIPNDAGSMVPKMSVDYTVGPGACRDGTQAAYWSALRVGQATAGTVYTRPEGAIATATLRPGVPAVLCPVVGLGYPTGTVGGQRDALLQHAGRAVDIRTVVRQRSQAPATWASAPQTVTSRYRVAMPSPVTPASSPVCQRTLAGGQPSSIGYHGGFFWGWPDAPTDSDRATPAMAGGWEILRRTRSGDWEVWAQVSAGSARQLAGKNSRDVSDQVGEVRDFKLRGYPFAGDRTRYVESNWIARVSNEWSVVTDRWTCHSPTANPDAGPHNLP